MLCIWCFFRDHKSEEMMMEYYSNTLFLKSLYEYMHV